MSMGTSSVVRQFHVLDPGPSLAVAVKPEPADLLFTRNPSWLGKAIRWACRGKNEPPTYANHVAIANPTGAIVEALWSVKRTDWIIWAAQEPAFELWRCTGLSRNTLAEIACYADAYVGRRYGWWKLGLHLGDALLTKIRGEETYAFRPIAFMDHYPICSWHAAYAFAKKGYSFDVAPDCADPDAMHDHCKSSGRWEPIYVKG